MSQKERRGRFVRPLSFATQTLVGECRRKLLSYLNDVGSNSARSMAVSPRLSPIETGRVRVKSVLFYTACEDAHVVAAVAELLGALIDVEVTYRGSDEVVNCLEFDLDMMLPEGGRRA